MGVYYLKMHTRQDKTKVLLNRLCSNRHSTPPSPHLLEVDELGLVSVEVETRAVVADGVPADGVWGVLELLGYVFDHPLAVHAHEAPAHLHRQQSVSVLALAC